MGVLDLVEEEVLGLLRAGLDLPQTLSTPSRPISLSRGWSKVAYRMRSD
jgi:hypothetical protein